MKKILTFALAVSMMASLAASASALEYSIAPPKDFDFGRDTSIEVIHTADGGAMRNTDMSKSAALIPPTFGSESMNALHTGEYLTPNPVSYTHLDVYKRQMRTSIPACSSAATMCGIPRRNRKWR